MRKSISLFLLAALAALALGGCVRTLRPARWNYIPQTPPAVAAPLLNRTIAVVAFADERASFNQDLLALQFIPIWPFGWQNYYLPELADFHLNSGRWYFEPTRDLAQAMAAELRNARLFAQVVYTDQPVDADFLLEGRLLSTRYTGYQISYGLSVLAPAVWALGAPSGQVSNEIEIEMRVRDLATGAVSWRGTFALGRGTPVWVYDDRDDFFYHVLFGQIAREAVAHMRETFQAAVAAR